MHWTRQLIVYLTVLTLLFLSLYSYYLFSEYKKYTQNVEHTYKVQNTTERLGGRISRLIALRWAYIITPEPDVKGLIFETRTGILDVTDSLESLTKDNRAQISNLINLRNLYLKSGLFSNNWFQSPDNYLPVDTLKAEMERSRPVSDSIFKKLNQMKTIEERLLQVRTTFQKNTGDIVPLMLLITGITAISTLVYAFYLISIELSERLKARDALEKTVHQLNLVNEELERFAFITSHNLKEPLRKSRTFFSRILPDIPSSASYFPHLQKVDASLNRLQRMLDDLFIFTKLLHHNEQKEALNLNLIADSVVEEFQEQIAETKAEIQIGVLPVIIGNAYQVTLIFHHLLSNALQFHKPDQHPVVVVSARFDTETGYQVIEFADDGIGFDTAFSHKVFEIFGRLHTQEKFEGTGIGLPICRRAMFNHNGYILVRSSPGNGARFSLYFPGQISPQLPHLIP